MGIQTGHQHQFLATRLDELFTTAIADLLEGFDAVGDEGRAHHQQLLHALLRQLVETRLGVGLDPLGAAEARLEGHRPLIVTQPGLRREAGGGAHALRAVAAGEYLALGTLAAIIALKAVRAGWIGLVQVTLGQPVETQQQMIEILLQMRPGTGDQRVEVLRLVVERLQDRQLQRQSALADDPARFLNDRRRGAVGELRIKRRQGDLGDALPGQTRQRGLNGGLAVAHRQLHRALRPVRTYRLVQTAAQHHQRRTFRPPDRGVGMRRLLGALDQD